jgi:hypothetical protein
MKIKSILKGKSEEPANLFSEFLTEDALNKLKKGKPLNDISNAKKGMINFVIVQVRDESLEKTSEILSQVVELIFKNEGFISAIVSSIVIATYGFPKEIVQDGNELLQNIAKLIIEKYKLNVRVVYGSAPGLYGNWGIPQSQFFGPLIPHIDKKLINLFNLKFGTSLFLS